MLTNIVARWPDILKLQQGDMPLPSFVDFHTSNCCNLNCHGCAYHGQLTESYMKEDRHFDAVDTFLNVGVRAFDFAGGGEPAMIPYLPRLMNYIASQNAAFALITNGTVLTDELLDAVLNGATYCRVSLEASNREGYAAYKQCNTRVWDHVLAHVKRLVSERNGRKSKCEISLKFSVGKLLRGHAHYERIFHLWENLGVDRVNIKALRHEPEELTREEKLIEEEHLWDLKAKHYFPEGVYSWIEPVDDCDIPQCWLNPLHTVMDHLGNIYICCFYYYREEAMKLGNIFETPFKQIWNSNSHRLKIENIDKTECSKVDCKFFRHHLSVDAAQKRGQVYFL